MVAIFKKGNFLRFLVAGVFTLSTSLVSCSSQTTDKSAVASSNIKTKVLRMGYQSDGDIVKVKGVLEKRLTPLGISVEWSKFAAGPIALFGNEHVHSDASNGFFEEVQELYQSLAPQLVH
ncbi:MAG: hypothetical protein V7K35_17560 [Nostoc sp.]|uniref:hypothetical protein n=1 Tax=Nostoc sp. TaxID=1180 RepID=UPI002FF9C757